MRSTESSTEMLSNAAEVVVQRAAVQPRHAQPSVRASQRGRPAIPPSAVRGGLYAYVPGMHKQVCSCPLDGVTAPAPAETADCTRTAPAHPCESRITRAAEERLLQIAKTPPRPRRLHFLTARLPGRSPSSADDQVALRYCLPILVMAAGPNHQCGEGFQNDLTI